MRGHHAATIAAAAALALLGANVARADTGTTLFDFPPSPFSVPLRPVGRLVADAAGNLYGVTLLGGTGGVNETGRGSVYRLSPPTAGQTAWSFTELHAFQPAGGIYPRGGLVLDDHGRLFGTASSARVPNSGTVFMLTPPPVANGAWAYTVLHLFRHFPGSTDGTQPLAPLVRADNGDLFGTTIVGGGPCAFGNIGCGTVFRLTPPAPGDAGLGTYEVIHRFSGPPDGAEPIAGLTLGDGGSLFGTTNTGGAHISGRFGYGTVFRLDPPAVSGGAWRETILHDFAGLHDGAEPNAQLTRDAAGNLFGTTSRRGRMAHQPVDGGLVFELSPPAPGGTAWTDTVLHRFPYGYCGIPSGVTLGAGGTLYGVTPDGGTAGGGTLFRLVPPAPARPRWGLVTLRSFPQSPPGIYCGGPSGEVVIDGSGGLVGPTAAGGANGTGTVFAFTP